MTHAGTCIYHADILTSKQGEGVCAYPISMFSSGDLVEISDNQESWTLKIKSSLKQKTPKHSIPILGHLLIPILVRYPAFVLCLIAIGNFI